MSRRQWSASAGIARALFWIGFPLWWLSRFVFAVLATFAWTITAPLRFPFTFFKKPLSRTKVVKKKKKLIPQKKLPKAKAEESLFSYDWIAPAEFGWKQKLGFWWSWRKRPPKKRYVPPVSGPRVSALFSVLVVSTGIIVSAGGWLSYVVFTDLPSPQLIRDRSPKVSTKIYDRHGRLLYTIFKDQNRTLVPLSDMSPDLIKATLAIEDADFYKHWGLSFRGISRALIHNLRKETLHGGSTITQQLVKITLLSPERTWQRKLREAVLALEVDAQYTKDEILYYYLNEVNYGGSVYGVEEASKWYFNKSASELTLAESAFLAGLPQAPSAYSPFGPNPEKAFERQHEVLWRMQEVGAITPEQREEALSQQLAFQSGNYDIQAPHFVMYIRSLLAERFGEEMVSQGGLEVYTTLDLDVQASAEAALAKELDRLGKLKVSNGASLVTDPRSGEILAMVGSRDYFDAQHDGSVNVTLSLRQPGSSIKPITYATAFEKGYTPSTTIDDTPVVYTSPGAPPYTPKNYDGRFHGKVTLRESLGSSYNIPAVRLLVDIGIDSMIAKARAMGISSWNDTSRFGLALTLGSGEVTMYDMMQVYGTFANGGLSVPLNPLIAVRGYDGKMLYSNPCVQSVSPCNARRTLSSMAAYQITSVLSDNQARTPAFGARSVLVIPDQEVAVKTGTTNSLRDNWTFGYTQDRVVGVWVGNNDNTPMSAVASGVTGASPIWQNIMKSQLQEKHQFALPYGLTKVKVCRQTGTLPCGACPQVVEEVFPEGLAPKQACTPEMFAQARKDEPQRTARRQ